MSLFPLPRQLPALDVLLDSMGAPRDAAVARFLGVTPRTVHNWRAANCAPSPATVALFLVSPFGLTETVLHHKNAAMRANSYAACMVSVAEKLQQRIDWLERYGPGTAANSSVYDAFRPQKSPHWAGLGLVAIGAF